ncbi:MAG TPA: DUF1080 domain-containing protein [Acidobacteriota bacterium]|nr:hypothetical protein [Acidobacteriota bacterium]HJO29100.1 DUF1080 domain-containing protein [Acidobacteriota bacterium]|tara:strand:- start:1628 stop:2338 length:711 start_codon:yes stop_codon:yes gene_type:complete
MESGRFVQMLMLALGSAFILAGEAPPEALATYQPYKVRALVTAQNLEAEGFERILKQNRNGTFSKAGWNHYGPGYFELDRNTGVLSSSGGMGLFWYAAEEFANFVLDLEFMTEVQSANSGVFVRVPGPPISDAYIYNSWEVQIYDSGDGIHQTGAVYDAEAPIRMASKGPGQWNRMRITFVDDHISVEINDEKIVDWDAEPRGKVESFAARGYIGLQNHDRDTQTMFRNIFVKSID